MNKAWTLDTDQAFIIFPELHSKLLPLIELGFLRRYLGYLIRHHFEKRRDDFVKISSFLCYTEGEG